MSTTRRPDRFIDDAPGTHPRLGLSALRNTWMTRTIPAMTPLLVPSSLRQHHAGGGGPGQPHHVAGREAALAIARIGDRALHQRAVAQPRLVGRHIAAISRLVQRTGD